MNPAVVVLCLIGLGFLFDAWWLMVMGVGMIFLLALASFVKSRQVVPMQPVPGGGPRHKLLQAPQDMWEDDDEAATFLAATGGPSPFSSLYSPMGGDPMASVSQAYQRGHPIPNSAMRNVLPFSGYGRDSAFEQVFMGLPVNIGALINRRVPP
jgi:hypothetical protein